MELKLCQGNCCPKVSSTQEGVEIGEKGNLVRLKKAEWNTLIDAVIKGKLKKI